MGSLGHRPDDGSLPLLRNYGRVDREVDQVRQWIGKGRSREAQETRREAVQASAVWCRRSKSPNIRYSDTSACCFSTVCFFRGSEYALSFEVLAYCSLSDAAVNTPESPSVVRLFMTW